MVPALLCFDPLNPRRPPANPTSLCFALIPSPPAAFADLFAINHSSAVHGDPALEAQAVAQATSDAQAACGQGGLRRGGDTEGGVGHAAMPH